VGTPRRPCRPRGRQAAASTVSTPRRRLVTRRVVTSRRSAARIAPCAIRRDSRRSETASPATAQRRVRALPRGVPPSAARASSRPVRRRLPLARASSLSATGDACQSALLARRTGPRACSLAARCPVPRARAPSWRAAIRRTRVLSPGPPPPAACACSLAVLSPDPLARAP